MTHEENYYKYGSDTIFIFLATFFVEIFLRLFSPLHLAGNIKAYQYDQELGTKFLMLMTLIFPKKIFQQEML